MDLRDLLHYLNTILVVLDLAMIVIVICYAIKGDSFPPLTMGLWVSISLIAHIQNLSND